MSQLIFMLMSRIHRQRKSFLALFLIALFAISVNVTQGAVVAPTAPVLKPTKVRLEYLGKDNYGYNYRVNVTVKNEGAAMTPNNAATNPALMININESSGSGATELTNFPKLPAGGEYNVTYKANMPVSAFTYTPNDVSPVGTDYQGLPGASMIIPTSTPYLYLNVGVMPDSKWSHDYSLYKTITKTFEIKADGRAVESAPDFKITDVKIVPVSVGAYPGQRFNAEIKVTNAGGPAYRVTHLKNYPPSGVNYVTENDVVVALRVTDRNKVQTGYIGRLKGPVIKPGQTETLRFLLPATARDMAGYSVKAMVNYGMRSDLGSSVLPWTVNNSVKLGIDVQPNATIPNIRYFESNYDNNYWVGYPYIAKPDFSVSNPRLSYVKENLPSMPRAIAPSTPFECYPGQLKGDLDHDGKITSNDATLMAKAYVGTLKPTNMCCVDIDGNGQVDINEPQKVTNAALGLAKLGNCSAATTRPKYFAIANVVNQGAPIYIGSSSIPVAFRVSFTANRKASTTAAVGYLKSKSGWLNNGALGEVKADVSAIFNKYAPNSFKVTRNVVKIDAASVNDITKGYLFEVNELNNSAFSNR